MASIKGVQPLIDGILKSPSLKLKKKFKLAKKLKTFHKNNQVNGHVLIKRPYVSH